MGKKRMPRVKADALRPQFHREEPVMVKGFWFAVKGVTQSGDLVLTLKGPSGTTIKRAQQEAADKARDEVKP